MSLPQLGMLPRRTSVDVIFSHDGGVRLKGKADLWTIAMTVATSYAWRRVLASHVGLALSTRCMSAAGCRCKEPHLEMPLPLLCIRPMVAVLLCYTLAAMKRVEMQCAIKFIVPPPLTSCAWCTH